MNSPFAVRCRRLGIVLAVATPALAVDLVVVQDGGVSQLKLLPPDEVFHTTEASVTGEDLIDVGGGLLLMYWTETVAPGAPGSLLLVQLR